MKFSLLAGVIALLPASLLLTHQFAVAQAPANISYQGVLTTGGGAPVTDGGYTLTFRLWDDSAAGSAVWTEAHSPVAVGGGSFNVILGSVSSLVNFDFNRSLYFEVTVDSGPAGPSYPLPPFPRSLLTSSPAALGPWRINGSVIHYPGGNVGVGTASPSEKLEIAGTVYSTSGGFKFPDGSIQSTASSGTITGTVFMDALSKYTATRTLANSGLYSTGGSLGIGTTTPSTPLEIVSDGGLGKINLVTYGSGVSVTQFNRAKGSLAGPATVIDEDIMGSMSFFGYDGASFIGAASIQALVSGTPLTGDVGGKLCFRTNDSGGTAGTKLRMTIEENGNVGIGTATPTERLQVIGNICATGTIAACSDLRYKERITPVSSALGKINALRGVQYYWRQAEFPEKQFTTDLQLGLIAQEVEKVVPEVVLTDREGYKSVDYARLTPVLIEAMKEQQREIERLGRLIEALSAKLAGTPAEPKGR